MVEERSGVGAEVAYRFTHAFFRQTLYEETIAPRRIRLHQQVGAGAGRGLRPAAGGARGRAGGALLLFIQPRRPEKAVEYGELAASRATDVFDYGEAERHLQQALKVQEVLDPDDKLKRCDLLLALGDAILPQEEPLRVVDTVDEEAFSLAEELADSPRAARAAVQAVEAFLRVSDEDRRKTPGYALWASRADQHAEEGKPDRVYADVALAFHLAATEGPAAGHMALRQAMRRAFELEEPAPFFTAGGLVLRGMTSLGDRDLSERILGEIVTRSRKGVRSIDLGVCLWAAGPSLLSRGDRSEAEAIWQELALLAERTRDAAVELQAKNGPVFLAFVDGRLEESIALYESRRVQGQQLGVTFAERLQKPPLLVGRAEDYLHDSRAQPGGSKQTER